MQKHFISLPFKMESTHGLLTADGIGKFSSAGIVLEFESKILGLMKTGVKEVRIPLTEILDIKLKSGVFNSKLEKHFSNRLEIRLNNFQTMSEIPNNEGKIVLKIARQDREIAEKALEALKPEKSFEFEESPIGKLFEDETKQLESNN